MSQFVTYKSKYLLTGIASRKLHLYFVLTSTRLLTLALSNNNQTNITTICLEIEAKPIGQMAKEATEIRSMD